MFVHVCARMQTTGKAFVMDDKFSLGDLLALELHNYVDACSEIVDRAQKELNIEKQLKKIEENWQALDLVFSSYQDTDIMALYVGARGCARVHLCCRPLSCPTAVVAGCAPLKNILQNAPPPKHVCEIARLNMCECACATPPTACDAHHLPP